jgi:hypothetical protein
MAKRGEGWGIVELSNNWVFIWEKKLGAGGRAIIIMIINN